MASEKQLTRTPQRQQTRMGVPDPFRRFRQEMDDVFSQYFPEFELLRADGSYADMFGAALDVSETDTAIEIELDVPGLARDDLDITLNDNALTISGRRADKTEDKGRDYHRVERRYGTFQRQVPLPCEVDPERVTAKLDSGVLTVSLPKSERAKSQARKIKVSGK